MGPIGLTIMVVLSDGYLQRIEHISITQALNINLAPKAFKRFLDDSHAIITIFRHPEQSRFINSIHDWIWKSKQAAQFPWYNYHQDW